VVTPQTISLPLLLSTTPTVSVVSNGMLAINGVISGSAGVTVTGGGSLSLSGNNPFTGNLTVNNLSTVIATTDTNLGGGNLVFLRGRLDSAYDAKGWEFDPYYRKHITQRPSAYLDRLYYDTCALSEDSNRFVIDTMGVDHVVFGSDYPFDIGDPQGRRSVPVIDTLPAGDKEKIYRSNALSLLNPIAQAA
jgi:autotransporter-associated beta strand protein